LVFVFYHSFPFEIIHDKGLVEDIVREILVDQKDIGLHEFIRVEIDFKEFY